MSETKPVSFRLDIDVANAFKELAETNGFTQTQALDTLISNFEMQKAKLLISDRKKEIEAFETYASKLVNIYLNSLELNYAAEERIREELSNDLNKKEEAINKLLKQENDLNKKVETLRVQNETFLKENKNYALEKEALSNDLALKNEIISQNQEQISMLNSILSNSNKAEEENKSLQEQLIILNDTIKNLQYKLKEKELSEKNLLEKIEFLNDLYENSKTEISNFKIIKDNYEKEKVQLNEQFQEKLLERTKDNELIYDEKITNEKIRYESLLELTNHYKEEMINLKQELKELRK
jgi:chromosome segregation ATPase